MAKDLKRLFVPVFFLSKITGNGTTRRGGRAMGVYIPREDVDWAGKIGLYEYFVWQKCYQLSDHS